MHSKILLFTSLVIVATASPVDSISEKFLNGLQRTSLVSTIPGNIIGTAAVLSATSLPLGTDSIADAAGQSRELFPPGIDPLSQDADDDSLRIKVVKLEVDEILIWTLPPVVPTTIEPVTPKASANEHLPKEPAKTSGKVQKIRSAASATITDAFKETLKYLPKPSSMPTNTPHYGASWSTSVSSVLSRSVDEGRKKKTAEEKQEIEQQRLFSMVTSAAAGFTSASIALRSASLAKARESKALDSANHKLNDYYKHAHANGSPQSPSPSLSMVSVSSVAAAVIGLVLAS